MPTPRVSLIVPAFEDEATIGAVLGAVRRLDPPPSGLEIILVDDASPDGTVRAAEAAMAGFLGDFKIIRRKKNRGLAAGMNDGVRAATGDFVGFVQSDCAVRGPDWIAKMLAPFADPTVGAVVSQRVVADPRAVAFGAKMFDAVAPQTLKNPGKTPREIDFVRGKADLYRREIFEKIGFFDGKTFRISGEDADFSFRLRAAGKKIVLSPDATVEMLFSARQRTLAGALRKARVYGVSSAQIFEKWRHDGLQNRLHAWAFFALFFAAAGFFGGEKTAAILVGIAAVAGLPRTVRIPILGGQIPVAAIFLVAGGGFFAAGFDPARAASAGIFLTAAGVFALDAAVAGAIHRKNKYDFQTLPSAMIFAPIWRALAGLAFTAERIRHFFSKK